MDIKILRKTDYKEAIKIKEKYMNSNQELSKNMFDKEKELKFLNDWMNEKRDDVRIMLGAYEEERLCGFIGGSYAEDYDSSNGFEINYLFIDEKKQKKGIGKSLIYRLCELFFYEFKDDVIVYTHRELPANAYYKQLGFSGLREEKQGDMSVEVLNMNIQKLFSVLNSFSFNIFDKLSDGIMKLVCTKCTDENLIKGYVPAYHFNMIVEEKVVGHIDARIGFHKNLYYGGHLGYSVLKKYRGRGYASKAVTLLKEVFSFHNINSVYITCNPENFASARTCEKAGAKYIKTIDLPKNNEMYINGDKNKYLYLLKI